jgi:hypothetical protein
MGCEGRDWKGYALEELSAEERSEAGRHLSECAGCREELRRIRATLGALRALPRAELPRPIVFVSETGLTEPWWRRLWMAGPAGGYASAAIFSSALLACAIVAHGWMMRPAAAASINDAALNARVEAAAKTQVAERLPQAVDAALQQRLNARVQPALVEARRELAAQAKRGTAENARLLNEQREADLKSVRYAFERLERRINYAMLASTRSQGGE